MAASFATAAAAHELVPPKPVLQPAAEWPDEPSTHDVVVPVVLTVGKDGAVEHVEVEVSVGRAFDAAAVRAARRWVFEPAHDDKGPVRAKVRAAVRFVGVPDTEPAPAADPPTATPAPPPPSVRVVGHAEEEHTVEVRGARRVRTASGVVRDRRVLEAAPRKSGSDLLMAVPGLFITQHSGEGKAHQIFFRGFDAIHGQDMEVLVGGIPVNDVSNIHGQGYADLNFVIPEVVDRIDALPGAFDPSQGDFAIAGSLRFRLGYREPGITARGSYGMFGTRRVMFAYHPEDEPEETFAAFEAYGTDGFGPARAAQRTSGMGQVLLPLGERAQLRMFGSAYAGRFSAPGVLLQSEIDDGTVDRFASYDDDQGGHTTRAQLGAEIGYGGDSWRLTVMPWVIRRTLELRFNFTGSIGDPANTDNTTQLHNATTLGLTGRFEKDLPLLSEHDVLAAGIFLRHDMIDQAQRATRGNFAPLVDADVSATDAAGWLELSVRPWSRLLVRAGVRADGLSYAVEDTLTSDTRSAQGLAVGPKATVDVAIVPGLHAIGSYGMGFRSPQARSLADGEATPFTRLHGFEAGLRYTLHRTLSASVAGFASLLSDDLVFNEATSRNEAVPGTIRGGVAADLTVTPTPWFVSAFGASYTRASFSESDARFQEGDLLPYVPQLVVRGDSAVTPVLARFWGRELVGKVGAGWSYLFNRPLPFGEIGTDILLLDAQASVRLAEVELGVQGTNLLGRAYNDSELTYASTFGAGPMQLIPRRHVTAGPPRTVLGVLTIYL